MVLLLNEGEEEMQAASTYLQVQQAIQSVPYGHETLREDSRG